MIIAIAQIVGLALLLTALALLPFLPGDYDHLAATLSEVSRVVTAVASVLLAPIGVVWQLYENRSRNPVNRRYFVASASAAACVVAVAALLAVLTNLGVYSGVLALALVTASVRAIATSARIRRHRSLPFILACAPTAALMLQWLLLPRAVDFGRNRSIANSSAMIRDIERYFDVNGHYPQSLAALWGDYKPSVIGVARYFYEQSGTAYNLYFEQPSIIFGTREIVMYNKLNQHAMGSHDSRILQGTPQSPPRRPGAYAVLDTVTPHWRRFLFD